MRNVYIIGVGMTRFGRHHELTVKSLTGAAVTEALVDAGCRAEDVDVAFFGNVGQGYMEGQTSIRGQVALLPLGFDSVPIHNVENACATSSTALHLAVANLRSGSADVALAVGVEKIHSPDKQRMFAFFDGGWDVHAAAENLRALRQLGDGVPVPADAGAAPHSVFMDVYAAFGRQAMRHFGFTQTQFAAVAAKNHTHAVHNPKAQYRAAMSVDDVLSAQPIVYPLTLPMCAPISDGAAAAILCTDEALKRLNIDAARAVRVRASVMRSASARHGDALARHVTRLAGDAAYESAGVAPSDIDVAEVHDATAIGELIQVENLRLCREGEAGAMAASGASALGGRLPINPSGGLESKGHPVGATGLGQVYELVLQLRGEGGTRQVEGARMALQENGGGLWGVEEAVAHIGIFERSCS